MKLKRCPVCLLDLRFLNHCGRGVEAATEGGSRVEEHSSFQISNQHFSAVLSQHLQPGQFFLWAPRLPKTRAPLNLPLCFDELPGAYLMPCAVMSGPLTHLRVTHLESFIPEALGRTRD